MEGSQVNNNLKQKTISSMIWKLMERFSVQGIAFIVSIIIARILSPNDYGILSIVTVFTTIASIFVHSGLNTALIQRNDVTEDDYSTVFWTSMAVAIVLYGLLFFAARWVALWYEEPVLEMLLRVMGLILFPYAVNSVQSARLVCELRFKYIFISNFVAGLLSGVIGIVMAVSNCGVWALVGQQLGNAVLICLVMYITARIKIRFCFSKERFKVMFSFGGKLMLAQLINNIKMNLATLLIGRKYSTEAIGIYERGKQFPHFIISSIDTAMNSVLLPVYSRVQNEPEKLKNMMRRSIKTSSSLIIPMMVGLCMLAEPVVVLLLTEKWLPCVPYLQLCCIGFAIRPIHTANLQALSATGRSGIYVKLEVIKLIITWVVLILALVCFDNLIAVAIGDVIVLIGTLYVNVFPNKKYLKYSLWEQLLDIMPSLLISIVMAVIMFAVSHMIHNLYLNMVMQFITGSITYLLLFALFQKRDFLYLKNTALSMFKRK